jgi:hypothetical protein
MRLFLSLVCASLLAGACYDSGASGGSSSGNSSGNSACEGLCRLTSELACGTQTFDECFNACEMGRQSLGPCISSFEEATECAVDVGGTCDAEQRIIINSGCTALFEEHQACLQANFDAGS